MLTDIAVADALVIVLAVAIAYAARFGHKDTGLSLGGATIGYQLVAVLMAAGWIAVLALGHTRDPRVVGIATVESGAIVDWTLRLFGTFAIVAYAAKIELARSFFIVALTLGLAGLLFERWAWRRWLEHERRAGRQVRHVLAVGRGEPMRTLRERLAKNPQAGYAITGQCDPLAADGESTPREVLSAVVMRAKELDVDAVAFVAPDEIDVAIRRRIDWALRDNGIDIIHVPPLDALAGARLWTEMVGGLPLIHVVKARTSLRSALKAVFDVVVSVLAIVLCALPTLAIAIAIKVTSPGPVFYVQRRVGLAGRTFPMVKFRTMRVGAHRELDQVRELDDGNGVLFKVRRDPRVTSVGRLLRRYSLDELPQFLNVLAGHMSVVGPRPPLPEELARYRDEDMRRLLVKPGITGLWQVSGRSDLSWEESIRLDLLYVDTWSIPKDIAICLRTVRAVLHGEGAY